MLNASNFPNALIEGNTTTPKIKGSTVAVWMSIIVLMIISVSKVLVNVFRPSKKVYLLDFTCYKPSKSLCVTKEALLEQMVLYSGLSPENYPYCKKVMEKSGLGDSTHMAEALLAAPPRICMAESRKEVETTIFAVVNDLLRKTGVAAEEVGIVVANCCIFSPTPSLSAMVVNMFGMRDDVRSFNLSGMGCSAGLAAIALANQLLQVHENTYALVVSTESISENVYMGKDPAKLVINCLFRVGGAAILLSNHRSAGSSGKCKYLLRHAILTHTAGINPSSYSCIYQDEDSEGHRGVSITKHLLVCANKAIRANLSILAPLVLPVKAQLRYLLYSRVKPYTPSFKLAFDHFFPHVGGKPVLDELKRALKFDDVDMEPARMTLYRFGNTSSSTVWYEMAYAEAMGRVKKGDRVWQVAFGSGFKCNSLVWRAVRSIESKEVGNPWTDDINQGMDDAYDKKDSQDLPIFFESDPIH